MYIEYQILDMLLIKKQCILLNNSYYCIYLLLYIYYLYVYIYIYVF